MAFPTTSVLDAFTRADASDLGANWSAAYPDLRHQIVSNVAAAGATGSTDAGHVFGDYWNGATFGPDTEVYATIPAMGNEGSNSHGVYARLTSDGDGYYAEYTGAEHVDVYKLAGWGFTQIGASFSVTLAAGDKIGMAVTGGATTTITIYVYTSGAWSTVGTRTDSDSPYTAAGYIGLQTYKGSGNTTAMTFDDFGGGTVSAGGTTYNDALALARGMTATAAPVSTLIAALALARGMTVTPALDSLAYDETVTLTRGLTAADAGTFTLAAALALARTLTATEAGGLDIGVTISLGRVEDATGGPALDVAGALSLTHTQSLSSTTQVDWVEALTLARGEALVASLGSTVYTEAVALARGLSLLADALAVLELALSLPRTDAVSDAATADLAAAVSIQFGLTAGPVGGMEVAEVLALARALGLSDSSLVTKEELIVLARAVGLQPETLGDYGVTLSLQRTEGAAVTVEATFEEAVQLVQALAMLTTGSPLTTVQLEALFKGMFRGMPRGMRRDAS